LYGFKISDEDPRTHTFLRNGSEIDRVVMYTGFGFGFLEDLFGIGYGLYISAFAEGSAVANEVPIILSDDLVLNSQLELDAKLTYSNLFGLYFQPGKKWKKLERLNLGLSYRSESKMEIDPLLVTITSDLGNVEVNALLTVIDFYQPNIITAGISYLFGDKMLISVDYEIQEWSKYEFTSEKEFNYGGMLPEFEDISVSKIGVQYKMSEKLTVLGGYYFQPSFISDRASSGLANFLDNDKHVFSIGLKYLTPRLFTFYRPLEITVGYQMQQLEERKVYKTDPTGPNPDYSYGGESHVLMIGFTY
jgi:long-subunit fatty acid transport protein